LISCSTAPTTRPGDLASETLLLRPGDEDADPKRGRGRKLRNSRDDVVESVWRLDDDAALARVVAPDVFDELRVVAALHPDPARKPTPAT
jgi:hypothetical protein